MTVAAIVAAAGRGERLGGGGPKALLEVGGVALLVHAVRALAAADGVTLVVVAAPADQVPETETLLGAESGAAALVVVAGGSTRPESVRRALAVLPPEVTTVLVHDAARGLAPVGLVEAVVAAVLEGAGAVVPGVPVVDTVKEVTDGVVTATVDRSRLVAVQTPQGFRRDVLARAHAEAGPAVTATDDAGLVERLGLPVVVVPGSPDAFKVTKPIDLLLAETVLRAREEALNAR